MRTSFYCCAILLSLCLLAGCDLWEGVSRQFSALTGYGGSSEIGDAFDVPAQVLASNAETAYREGEFDQAAEMYQNLRDRFPYSKYALLAELRLGDAYQKAERWDEAALAYEDFIRLRPRNEAVPYAMFQLGMTYHAQMLKPQRDFTNAAKALEVFKRLIANYPTDEYSYKALPRMEECAANLAQHDMGVGDFYKHRGRYEAAMGRYKQVITQYPDAGYYNEALAKLKECEDILEAMDPEKRAERDQNRRDIFVPPPSMQGISGIIGPAAVGF